MFGKPPEPALTCSGGSAEVAGIAGLLAFLAARSLAVPERTASGYRLQLPASMEVESALKEFVRRDKECCPFLEFAVERRPEVVRLDVSGPAGASRLLDACVELVRAVRNEAP